MSLLACGARAAIAVRSNEKRPVASVNHGRKSPPAIAPISRPIATPSATVVWEEYAARPKIRDPLAAAASTSIALPPINPNTAPKADMTSTHAGIPGWLICASARQIDAPTNANATPTRTDRLAMRPRRTTERDLTDWRVVSDTAGSVLRCFRGVNRSVANGDGAGHPRSTAVDREPSVTWLRQDSHSA